jgi:hypothetical protein
MNVTKTIGWLWAAAGACGALGCGSMEDMEEGDVEAVESGSLASVSDLSTDWEAALGWCNHAGAQVLVGDVNGDGRSDMLCHDTRTGHKWVAHATAAGNFTGTTWEAGLGWCNHAGAQLHIGDFNGDSRDDMLCHDTRTGYKWVARATGAGRFTGTTWEANLGWCNHATAALHIGDFNGDSRDDMLCHDVGSGYKWVALASPAGRFTGTSWEGAMGWCNHTGAQLLIGDVNADWHDDLLCHDMNTGHKWLSYGNL